MKMTLSDVEFIRLLPQFMRDDPAVKGLSLGLDIVISKLAKSVERLTTWDKIDELSEAELDDLAWELNILWYEQDADISIKREVIKNSDKVYQHLGTKWAVENVIASYFGDGYVEEWFEYDGQPGRFRIHTSNPITPGTEKLQSFLNLLNKVKRASAHLDAILVVLEYDGHLTYGVGGELSAQLEIWPRTPRAIDSSARVAYTACNELFAKLEIHPFTTRNNES